MDLIEFLRVRLDEDEAAARAAGEALAAPWRVAGCACCLYGADNEGGWRLDPCGPDLHRGAILEHVARWDPARVLAEVEDWRNVLTAWEIAGREPGPAASYAWVLIRDVVIRPRLARYADHPDFDPAWLSR